MHYVIHHNSYRPITRQHTVQCTLFKLRYSLWRIIIIIIIIIILITLIIIIIIIIITTTTYYTVAVAPVSVIK